MLLLDHSVIFMGKCRDIIVITSAIAGIIAIVIVVAIALCARILVSTLVAMAIMDTDVALRSCDFF